MLTKLQIVQTIALLVVVHDQVDAYKTRKRYAETLERNNDLHQKIVILQEDNLRTKEALATAYNQGTYLLNVLNKHEIEADEFDRIVFNDLL